MRPIYCSTSARHVICFEESAAFTSSIVASISWNDCAFEGPIEPNSIITRAGSRRIGWAFRRRLRPDHSKFRGRLARQRAPRRYPQLMVTREDNDLLTRVEGDWPMGHIMRRHWLPACLSEEVAEPDGTPVRT